METKRKIPFIKSRGFECGQTCAAMMIKYYCPDFEPDFNEFNKIIRHQENKYTFPLQNALLLDHYGINTKCYSSDDYRTTQEDPDIFKRWFGEEYDQQIKFIDVESYNWMCRAARKKDLFEKKPTSFDDIIDFFQNGLLVSFVVDWHTLKNKKGNYQGHFVLLTGLEGDQVQIHDPDEGSHLEYPRATIEEAYRHPAITDDVFVALGKKIVDTIATI